MANYLILLTTSLLCVPGILSQDLNCDENTQVHVVLKLFNVQGNPVTGLAMNAENSAGDELMSGTTDSDGEIHQCAVSDSIDGSITIDTTSGVSMSGITGTVSHLESGHFVTTAHCESFPCVLDDSQLDSCGDNVLVNLAVHDGSGGGDWHQEISWTLYEDNVKYLSGFAPYDGVLCFDESKTYKFEMRDSWGDGWHDNLGEFTGVNNNFAKQCTLRYGFSGSCTFSLTGVIDCDDDHQLDFSILNDDETIWTVVESTWCSSARVGLWRSLENAKSFD